MCLRGLGGSGTIGTISHAFLLYSSLPISSAGEKEMRYKNKQTTDVYHLLVLLAVVEFVAAFS